MTDLEERHINELVAEQVMGECRHGWYHYGPNVWNYACRKCGTTAGNLLDSDPASFRAVGAGVDYAGTWSGMGLVMERVAHSLPTWCMEPTDGGGWQVTFGQNFYSSETVKAATLPMAVCLAALRAVGVEV